MWCRVFDNSTSDEVLLVFPELMARIQELSVQVDVHASNETQELPCMWGTGTFHAHTSQRIAHTPASHASSTCTTHALGSFFCSGVVCLDPIIPSFLQFILKRLHVHIHILPRIVGPENYQRQENVLSLHNLSGGGY